MKRIAIYIGIFCLGYMNSDCAMKNQEGKSVKPNTTSKAVVSEADALEKDTSIFGTWKITSLPKHVRGDISGITNEEEKNYVGKEFILLQYAASIYRDTCSSPNYETKVSSADEYFYDSKSDKKVLNIKGNQIKLVYLQCDQDISELPSEQPFMYDFINYDDNKWGVKIQGSFFSIKKIKSEKETKIELPLLPTKGR